MAQHDKRQVQLFVRGIKHYTDLYGPSNGEEVKYDLSHREIQLLLCNELYDLNEDIQRGISWNHSLEKTLKYV